MTTTSKLHLLLWTSLFLFSCTRAVDDQKTTISISLPSTQSVKRFSSNLTSLNLGAVTPAPASTATDYAPEPITPGEYAGLCYMVVVGYPAAEANRNYCGMKNLQMGVVAPNDPATTDDVNITPSFYFSQNFKGLFDPNATPDIEIPDIFVGENRTFTVIAIPTSDLSACQDILDKPINKTVMLRPRIIGTITQDVRVGNNDVKINIDTVNYLELFDDCIITDTKLNYPEAEKMIVEQESFPFNYIRGYTTENRGFVCQPLVVGLRAGVSGVAREVPAALNFDSNVSVQKIVNSAAPTVITTYNSHEHCISDVAGTQGKTDFSFPRNHPSRKRWVQLREGSGNLTFMAYSIDSAPEINNFVPAVFKVGTAGSYVLDHNIPRVLQLDVCYKVSSTIREIYGGVTVATGQIINMINSGSTGLRFYTSAASCDNNSPASSIPIAASSRGTEYWIKAPSSSFSSGDRIYYYLTYTGTPLGSPSTPFTPYLIVYASVETQSAQLAASGANALNIDQIGYANAVPKVEIPNVTGGCYPLTVSINNRLGAVLASNPGNLDFRFLLKDLLTLESFENVPLRYQAVDIARDGVTGGYGIQFMAGSTTHTNPCVYTDLTPIGTSGAVTGTPTTSSNGTFYTLFIRTDGSASGTTLVGRRRIQFYYGGTSDTATIGYPAGQVDFELTSPD